MPTLRPRAALLLLLVTATASHAMLVSRAHAGRGHHRRVAPCAICACEQPQRNPQQVVGRVAGYLYIGNVAVTVTIGVLSRLGLISLPPINTLTDIANNAMDAEIAAGTLQPLLATGWSIGFWLDLLRQYNSFEGDGFVASYCAEQAALCAGVVF